MASTCLTRAIAAAMVCLPAGGSAMAAMLHVPSGSTQSISGTHTFDSILIEGRLNLSGSTTLVSRSTFTIQNGEIWGVGANGGNGSDGTLLNPPTDGVNAGTGRTLVVRADGDINLSSGRIDLRGGNAGNGGDAAALSNHDGGDGGRGGNAGNLSLLGESIYFEDFLINTLGGAGGNGGQGGGVNRLDLAGWGGDAGNGGNLLIDYVDKVVGLPPVNVLGNPLEDFFLSGGKPGVYELTASERATFGIDTWNQGFFGFSGKLTVVPEPATAFIFAAGGSLLVMRRRSPLAKG